MPTLKGLKENSYSKKSLKSPKKSTNRESVGQKIRVEDQMKESIETVSKTYASLPQSPFRRK